MGCKDTCHIAISALLTYVVQTRIGFCKLCILVTCIIASAIASVTFTNTDGDIKYAGAGGFAFVLFATNWSLVTSLISILIFGWRWNEWMWLLKNFPWKKIEFWWSLVHIFLMIAAGLVSFIGLAKLGATTLKGEVIATGVFCFLAGIPYIVIAATINGSINLRNVNV